MNGVRVAVHQSSSRSEQAEIVLHHGIAVGRGRVDEIAPRWITASSLRPSSQRMRSAGGTKSAIWRFRRLRHLPSLPSTVADDDIGAPGLVEARDHVRSDEPGPAGDQQHRAWCRLS